MKLSPNVTKISDIALACEIGGADAVSAINTVVGMGIDIFTKNQKFLQFSVDYQAQLLDLLR